MVKVDGCDKYLGRSFKAIVFLDENGDLMLAGEKKSKSLGRAWDFAEKYQRFLMEKIGETSVLDGRPDVDDAVEVAKAYFSADDDDDDDDD